MIKGGTVLLFLGVKNVLLFCKPVFFSLREITATSKGISGMKRHHESRSGRFVLARTFASSRGIRIERVIRYCETGRIPNARFDRILWQWVIYPPFRLLIG